MSDLTLQIAASGIAAEEAQLDTASNNLANVGTPGYARQVVNQADVNSSGVHGSGDGVLINSITEDSSSLYDQLSMAAQGQLSAANETVAVQNLAQDAFPISTGSGLSSQLNQMWTDLSTLATEPGNSAAQQTVVQDAGNVASTLNSTSAELSTVGTQLQGDLGAAGSAGSPGTGYIGQANQLIDQIAQINGQLAGLSAGASGSGGLDINTLADEQRNAVATLSGLIGAKSTTEADGTMTVSSGGIQLVSGSVATNVQTTGYAGNGSLAVETTHGNVIPAGGTIGALLTGVNVTLPHYQSSLDAIADSVGTGLNTLQAGGVSANGVPGAGSAAGAPPYAGALLPSIFVNGGSATTYAPGAGSAATIAVNPALSANPSLIATASGTATAGVASIDPTTAQAMARLGASPVGPDAQYQALVALVGTQTAQAQNTQTSAQALANSTTTQQSSVEGVNTNDETVNMLAAQQSYQALASVISSATSAIESLLSAVN